ncbi:MAG TPA: hypothetical protein VJY12_06570 [Dysgonamonadaceae bacterium]|nr:hypothetical protein [Dysgonamonadaceae bacterium]
MSLQCPLCGKSKTKESLFCTDCTLKLNNEYEVSVPNSENSDSNIESEQLTPEEPQSVSVTECKEIKEPSKPTQKELKESAARTEKKYYEMSEDKPRKKTRFILISIFVFAVILVSSLYIYNEHVKDQNLERSVWELAQRENSIDSYLEYIDAYPQGDYVAEAQEKMYSLKGNESEAWENLRSSESAIEFTAFLETYPNSPYEKMVRGRLDSIVWQSSLKDNSIEAYSDYLNMSNEGDITGQYIGEAQKRLNMLEQSAPINEYDLERIKETVDGFFSGLSNVSHTELSKYLSPIVSRFNNTTNIPNEKMVGQLLLLASKSDSKSILFEPEITKLIYEKQENDTYIVNVPTQKSFVKNDGATELIKGYIIHLKLDPNYRIYSFYETKPFSSAP